MGGLLEGMRKSSKAGEAPKKILSLNRNKITGTIPSELGKLNGLNQVLLDNNSLIGPIPSELGQLERMMILALDSNSLTGSIPSSFGNLNAVIFLLLSDNYLTGQVPEEVCSLIRPSGNLAVAAADCLEEVVCDCCRYCF